MSQNIKKSYRDKIFNSVVKKGREFEYEGMKLFFRFPTRKDKREIVALATDKDGQLDHTLFETYATIVLTQVAETKEPLFSNEDFDLIENLEMGSLFDKVSAEALLALIGEESDPKA